jgi:PAS domain S-box-containing protein
MSNTQNIPHIENNENSALRQRVIILEQTVERLTGMLARMQMQAPRDAILETMGHATEQFLRTPDLHSNIQNLIERLGIVTDMSRVYIFENLWDNNGTLTMNQRYEWVTGGITRQIDNPALQYLPYRDGGYGRWEESMRAGNVIYGEVESFPTSERTLLEEQDILSIAIVPIFVGHQWWGFIGFDDCHHPHLWSNIEIETLRMAASIIGAAIQREHMQEELRESEASLRALLNSIQESAFLIDTEGIILQANQTVATHFGFTVEEFIGKYVFDLPIPGDILKNRQAVINQVIATRQPVRFEDHNNNRYVDHAVYPVLDSTGQVSKLAIFALDITERRRASEERYHMLVETVPDAVLITDQDNTIRFCNQQASSLFGYTTPNELCGKKSTRLVVGAQPNESLESFSNRPAIGSVRRMEYTMRRKDGSQFPAEVSCSMLTPSREEAVSFIIVVRDLSERKKLQMQIVESERFAASGRLAATVAHEINTPLQSLDFSLEMAQIASESQRRTFLEEAREEIQRIAQIVRQLLDFSRPSTTTHGPIAINTLIERTLLLTSKWIRDQGIVVERNLTPDIPILWGHPDELIQVLLNLLLNAIHAMPDGGKLTVGTRLKKRKHYPPPTATSNDKQSTHLLLVIDVTDTGCGINPNLQERIFEPFVTTRENGTGLGLAISTQIVQKHGGSIKVKSQTGQGSTFTIVLPFGGPRS